MSFQYLFILFFLAEAPIHSVGYQSLVGNNEHSWGWDLGRNKVYHNSKVNPGVTYPPNLKHDETFVVPDKFLGEFNFHSSYYNLTIMLDEIMPIFDRA